MQTQGRVIRVVDSGPGGRNEVNVRRMAEKVVTGVNVRTRASRKILERLSIQRIERVGDRARGSRPRAASDQTRTVAIGIVSVLLVVICIRGMRSRRRGKCQLR